MQNDPGDKMFMQYEHSYEEVVDPFSIAGIVPVAAGEYRYAQQEIRVETTTSRTFGVTGGVRWGGVYDGDFLSVESGFSVRPSKHIELSAGYDYIDFDLPSGNVGIHIASADSTIAFTPDMTIKTEVQYDNISEAFTFFTRFSWEPIPEREIFLSFGHTALINADDFPRDFRSLGSGVALRLGHTFRM